MTKSKSSTPKAGSGKGAAEQIHADSAGQFAPKKHGAKSDGVMSARASVVTGSKDATVHPHKADKKRK